MTVDVKKVLASISLSLLLGCTVGGFEVSQPEAGSHSSSDNFAVVDWAEYLQNTPNMLQSTYNGCAFFYFKMPLGCYECDVIDKALGNYMVVAVLDEHFRSFKITPDDQHWKEAIKRFRVQNIPSIFIVNYSNRNVKLVSKFQDSMNSHELYGILLDAVVEECYIQ